VLIFHILIMKKGAHLNFALGAILHRYVTGCEIHEFLISALNSEIVRFSALFKGFCKKSFFRFSDVFCYYKVELLVPEILSV